eukprot:8695488-Alexandrium_andersonii.AAC.1
MCAIQLRKRCHVRTARCLEISPAHCRGTSVSRLARGAVLTATAPSHEAFRSAHETPNFA